MRRIVLVLATFCLPAAAADFRAADFGASCADIAERETQLGSTPISWNPSGPEFVAFRGKAFDREVAILYLCPKDTFFTGNYIFPDENLEQAVRSLRSVYDKLTDRYGAPYLDATPWQAGADPRGVQPDSRKYMVNWRDARVSTTISVMSRDNASSKWHVLVVAIRNRPQ
jgi:hypothetical protein